MADKIYFGHPINFYNTSDEEKLVKAIEERFLMMEVENPNQPHHQEGYERWKQRRSCGMDYYFQEVLPKMAAGVFLSFADGMFGAGVWSEAIAIASAGKPIYEIDLEGRIETLKLDPHRKLTIVETRERVYPKK